MFEKEAEERYYKNYPVTLNIGEEERYKKVTDIWQDGAEFGYNKANEWHYVKEGDLPKTKGNYLVTWKRVHQEYGEWGFDVVLFDVEEKCFEGVKAPIAWKEIVLPKEIKEND